jgi:hypothetical protein
MDPSADDMTLRIDPELYRGVERRALYRARSLFAGKIIVGDGRMTADCVIRNLSARGAHVRISGAIELPRGVRLLLIKEGLLFDATVVWRSGDKTGLVFDGQHDLLRETDPALRGMRALWEDLRPR